jgi:hypothetical protein
VEAPDVRIVLRGKQADLADDPVAGRPGQPTGCARADGTVWTSRKRWRIVAGTCLRTYDRIE